jgi:AAA+ superfamily predicted ATPase
MAVKTKQSTVTTSQRPPEFQCLEKIIMNRLDRYFGIESNNQEPVPFPKLRDWWLNIPDYLIKKMDNDEATLLLIALAPHLQPDLFDNIIESKIPHSAELRVIGGVRGKNFRGFLPTGETALFIIAGDDLKKRFHIQKLLEPNSFLARQMLLWLEEPPSGEPVISGKLIMSQEYIELFTYGIVSRPKFGISFPAQYLETQQEWDDLVLPEETMEQVDELQIWIRHNDTLLNEWGMSRKLMPGYKVLFYGPPGTGKTMTASLLGKYTGRDVYKIDLSMVVSKFIGETEKNLATLFDKAGNKDWILFFDEADALFGKRTSVRDAHDKYANQEVSYLLQKIENYNGLVILASNFKNNIDDAFIRRFQSQIYFPVPKYEERLKIWKKAFPEKVILEEDEIDLSSIARQYELTGSNIMNIVHYACLKTIASGSNKLSGKVLLSGIKKEFRKEGKIL